MSSRSSPLNPYEAYERFGDDGERHHKKLYECCVCGNAIREGDTFYLVDGFNGDEIYCVECMKGFMREAEAYDESEDADGVRDDRMCNV